MKTILAFGDSLTWGSDPKTARRHPPSHRWPDVLAGELGQGVQVIADGLRGRTTAYDEHLADCDRNGARLLPTALFTHAPVDLVIAMLGSNDMKPHIAGTAVAAMQGMRRIAQIVASHGQGMKKDHHARMLIVAPPPLVATQDAEFAAMFDGGVEQSRRLAGFYADVARELGCRFFDAGTVAQASPIDSVHLDADNTRAIGMALAPIAADILDLPLAKVDTDQGGRRAAG